MCLYEYHIHIYVFKDATWYNLTNGSAIDFASGVRVRNHLLKVHLLILELSRFGLVATPSRRAYNLSITAAAVAAHIPRGLPPYYSSRV